MKNYRRSYKIHYDITFQVRGETMWWCYKCKRFAPYSQCGGTHTVSNSVDVNNIKQVNKIINKIEAQYSEGEIKLIRFLKPGKEFGHKVEELFYNL